MPPAERKLWEYLRGRGLLGLKFRRQHGIGLYILDFYCPSLRFGIEIDGDSHFEDGYQKYDARRDRFLLSFGIKIYRFTNHEVYWDLENVLEQLKKAIEERRGTSPTPPS